MNIPKISDILHQKIAEIQSRIPVKLNIPIKQKSLSFEYTLNEALSKIDNKAPVIDSELVEGKTKSKTKYPLVSGSYNQYIQGCPKPRFRSLCQE